MSTFEEVWERIQRSAGQEFRTKTGLPFTYSVPGSYIRINREGEEINRSLSKTNFAKAHARMPVDGPGDLKDRQGRSYTWAILMDERIRRGDW